MEAVDMRAGVPKPGPVLGGYAPRKRTARVVSTVTVKRTEEAGPDRGVFARLDVNAETAEDAERELHDAYCLAKNQLAAIALTEKALAEKGPQG